MKFVLTDIDYKDNIRLFGWNKDKPVIIIDKEFKPYLLVNKKVDKEEIGEFKILKIEKTGKLYKVVVNKPEAVRVFKELYKDRGLTPYEFDVPVTQRYLIDKGLTMLEGVDSDTLTKCKVEFNPKILAFDIETTNKRGISNPKIDEVIMISLWSNYGIKKVITTKKSSKAEYYPNEKEMLNEFSRIIKQTKPAIIVTYNGDNFDWPFLRERMNKYNISRDYGIDGSTMTIIKRKNNSSARIKGIMNIDLYLFVLKILSSSLKTTTLDLGSVSSELINNTKIKIEWDEFYEQWNNNDLDKIIDYSLRDAQVTFELFNHLKSIMFELTRMVNKPLYETCRSGYSSLVEDYLINKSKEFNQLIPKMPSGIETMKRRQVTFTGGYVHQPIPGIYENIAVVDFRSLYPTIMVSYNIGPTTLSDKGNKIYKYHFSKKKGFIPSIVEELINKRAKIKKELKIKEDPLLKARSYAIKTITNATYGYLTYPRSRWYCYPCGETITYLGRKHIKEIINEAEKEGFKVCYGDTDSAFLVLGNKTKKDLINFLKKINDSLPGIMELELERICIRGLFVSGKNDKGVKKRYVLLDENGKLIIKGFEFVRGDWSNISRETQYKVFEALLKDNNKEKAINIIKEIISKLKQNKIPLKELIIRTQLTRKPEDYKSIGPHVAVAKRLEKKGHNIAPGTIISYIVVKGKGLIRDKAKTIDEVIKEKLEPDADYYINHQVIPTVSRVLETLNINLKQEGLNKFL